MRLFSWICVLGALLGAVSAGDDLYNYGRSPVVQLTTQNFKSNVLESNETWFVEFYAPWCGHCRNLVPAWEKAADHLKGVVNFGGVNCDDYKDIAQKYAIRGFPTIKIFKGTGAKARRPTDYSGQRTAKALVEGAKSELPNFVVAIKSGGIDNFLEDDRHLAHVILFTDKTTTSHLYKSLSASFLGKASLGEIRKKEADAIKSKFGVTSYPTFVYFPPGGNADTAKIYAGDTDPDALRKFVESVVEGSEVPSGSGSKDSKSSEGEAEDEASQKFYKPPEHKVEVTEVVGTKSLDESCVKRMDGAICVLAFVGGTQSKESVSGLMLQLAERYKYDNFAFTVADAVAAPEALQIAQKLGLDVSGGSGVAVIRGRRNKFAVLEPTADLTVDGCAAFMDRVLGGDVRYTALPADLPVWESDESDAAEEPVEEKASSSPEGAGASAGSATADSTWGTDKIHVGQHPGKEKVKEFGVGSANDPMEHPGEVCDPDKREDTKEEDTEKEL